MSNPNRQRRASRGATSNDGSLGFGSGDLRIRTSGATHEQIDLINVLFLGSKAKVMQRLIAEVPEEPEST